MLQQPNPWILLMGGIALINVGMAVSGVHAHAWVRYGGMAACMALGVTCMGLGVYKYFNKKPPPQRFVSRRQKAAAKSDPRG